MGEDRLFTEDEYPAWLRALIDQRVMLFKDSLDPIVRFKLLLAGTAVITPLVEFGEDNEEGRKIWDESCDHCKRHFPGEIYNAALVHAIDGLNVQMFFGLCADCKKEMEDGQAPRKPDRS